MALHELLHIIVFYVCSAIEVDIRFLEAFSEVHSP
jgi:hypothetical protein